MRKLIYTLIAIFNFGLCPAIYSQCPGCLVNTGCTVSPAAPAICPDTLPDGVAMQAYSEDISFYLPSEFVDNGTGFNVTMNQLTVLSVSGLPYGINWETNASGNVYYPSSNPPATEYGCAKMCGTPLMPGTYAVTVFVRAEVTVAGIGQTVDDSFILPLTIYADTSSNGSFTIVNPMGCVPHTTGFINNLPSNGHAGYSYIWDFDNGNLSNLENPPVQNFNSPGNYIVTMQSTVDTLGYFLSSLSVLGANSGCDDNPFSAPDFYFVLKDGTNTVYTSAYIDNTEAPVTFSFSPIQLYNITYTVEVWDYDSGLSGADDHCSSDVTFNGYLAGTHSLTNSSLTVSITIDHPVITLNSTDTVKVYPSPIAGNVLYSPNDSICASDSILLHVAAGGASIYQWFRDTVAVYNAIDSFYYAKQSGIYYCEVMNIYGCRANTNNQKITIITNPPKPTFWIVGNTLNTNLSGYFLQWYFEGSPISGASGMTCPITATGNYFLIASNNFGCNTASDTILATYNTSGIIDISPTMTFKIFPNPSKGIFTIETNLKEKSIVEIKVTDLLGKVLFEENLGENNDLFHYELNLENACAGMYLITITANGNKVFQRVSKY